MYGLRHTRTARLLKIGVSLPRSLVVVYFGRDVSTTVTSVVKCGMLTLLQPLPVVPFPPSVRVSFPSKAAEDASGLRAAPNPHALLEANAAKPETTGYAQYPPLHAIFSH